MHMHGLSAVVNRYRVQIKNGFPCFGFDIQAIHFYNGPAGDDVSVTFILIIAYWLRLVAGAGLV